MTATRYDILPEVQRALLPALSTAQAAGQVLYGGTAIALQLGHRESIDFDFFSDRALDEAALVRAVPVLARATTLQRAAQSWTVQVFPLPDDRPVKLSFFGGLQFGRVGAPAQTDRGELLLASLDDLFGHKLKVLLQRAEAKDYRDIAALIRAGRAVERGLGAASALYGPLFPTAEALRAMTYFEGGDLDDLTDQDRTALIRAAQTAGPQEEIVIVSRHLDEPA